MMRADKVSYYLDIAQTVGAKSTCMRTHYGAVIVKNDEIISTGYNGSPRGCTNCSKIGQCPREVLGTGHGDAYNLCMSVHAEMNAMLSAARTEMLGATVFIVGIRTATGKFADPAPCLLCHRMLINSGIVDCYGRYYDPDTSALTDIKIDISNELFVKRVRTEYDKLIPSLDYETTATLVGLLDQYVV